MSRPAQLRDRRRRFLQLGALALLALVAWQVDLRVVLWGCGVAALALFSPLRLLWLGRAALALTLGVAGTGLYVLLAHDLSPGYFPLLYTHQWLAEGLLVFGLAALVEHLRETNSRHWVPIGLSALAILLTLTAVDAFDFPEPMSLLRRQQLLLAALAGRRTELGPLRFELVRGTFSFALLILLTGGLTLAGLATPLGDKAGPRRSGQALNLITVAALTSGATITAVSAELRFGMMTLHSALGTGAVLLLGLHVATRRLRRRVSRWISAGVGLAAMSAAAVGWTISYPREHFRGYRPEQLHEVFALRSTGREPEDRVAQAEGRVPVLPAGYLPDSLSCGAAGCHEQITAEWAVSGHRYSADNVFYRAAVADVVERHGLTQAALCANCHDPGRLVAGTFAQHYADGAPPLAADGVSCAVCHGIAEVSGEWENPDEPANGYFRVAIGHPYPGEGEAQRAAIRADPRRHRQAMVTTDVTLSARACEVCHRMELSERAHALARVSLQRPRVPERGHLLGPDQFCGDCHLPVEGEEFHYAHQMRGANVDLYRYAITRSPEDQHALERESEAVARFAGMRRAEPFEVAGARWQPGLEAASLLRLEASARVEPAQVAIALRTHLQRTAHQFPSGPLDLQQIWLQVQVLDADGAVLGQRGAEGPDGLPLDPPARMGARELDATGRPIERHRVLEMVELVDKRIVWPDEPLEDRFEVPLERPGVPHQVRLRWLFRRARPAFSEWAAEGDLRLPLWELGAASVAFD